MFREPLLEPFIRFFRFQKVLTWITPNSTVVDIGCGHTPHLLNRLKTVINKGVGIDQLITSKRTQNIRLYSYLLDQKIPLKANTADFVTLVAVLEHLENPLAIFKEAFRILKPQGRLLLTTPTPANKPLLEFLSFRLHLVSTREIAEHKSYFWKKDLIKMAKKAKFKKINHQYFEFYLNNFLTAIKPR